jgi:hypothetical protein
MLPFTWISLLILNGREGTRQVAAKCRVDRTVPACLV